MTRSYPALRSRYGLALHGLSYLSSGIANMHLPSVIITTRSSLFRYGESCGGDSAGLSLSGTTNTMKRVCPDHWSCVERRDVRWEPTARPVIIDGDGLSKLNLEYVVEDRYKSDYSYLPHQSSLLLFSSHAVHSSPSSRANSGTTSWFAPSRM